MRPRNPFKPTAGATPPEVVGRRTQLEQFDESLDDGPGSPGRLTIFTGARGVGKTVMLTQAAERALSRGWVVISDTATPGLLDRLTRAVTTHLEELDPHARPSRPLTGVTLPVVGGGLTLAPGQPGPPAQWRTQVTRLLEALEPHQTGLLITIDEVHRKRREDMRQIAATYQHLVREDRDVALVLAGLPAAVSDLLNDDVLTFLRRAHRETLHDVALPDAAQALRTPIEAAGLIIDDDALTAAAAATGGYPFLIQLVGYHVWRTATDGHITADSARAGIATAIERLGTTVLATALADLSPVDRSYLAAMAQDDGPASTSTVAARLGVSVDYGTRYRSRLIDAGVIEPTSHGFVDFTIPHLRQYLRDHPELYPDHPPTRR